MSIGLYHNVSLIIKYAAAAAAVTFKNKTLYMHSALVYLDIRRIFQSNQIFNSENNNNKTCKVKNTYSNGTKCR